MKRIVLALILLATPAWGDTKYYPSGPPMMANGMDLDRDFVLNEAGVDDLACDEQDETTTLNVSTENLDGSIDAALEAQIYVALGGGSEGTGTDNSTCGPPGTPCATIQYAVETRYAAVKASTSNGFICVNGTTTTRLSVLASWSGDAGVVTETAASVSSVSNQRWDHDYPQNPLVIMGWDTDNDNEYPPVDTDDEFIMDSGSSGIQCTPNVCPGLFELAHATFKNNGNTSSTAGGWIHLNSGQPDGGSIDADNWYLHDNLVEDVNDQQCEESGNVVMSFQDWWDHLIVVRNHIQYGGGYVWRGGKSGSYHLYKNNYFEASALGGPATTLDNNGNSCSGAGGSEKTGSTIMRTWFSETGDSFYEYIDNSFVVDLTVGTNGYTNGIHTTGEIVGGIILGGWHEWNWSGNYVQDIRGGITALEIDEGISIDQKSENQYRNHNTLRATHADAFLDSVIFGVTGLQDANAGTGGVRDEYTGTYELNDNCIDWDTATADIAQVVNWAGTGSGDISAMVLRFERNQATANWNGSRGMWWVSTNSGATNGVPAEFHFSDNHFANENGVEDDSMFKSANLDWSAAWDSGNGNNVYYGSTWEDAGTSYSTLALWEARTGIAETGSSEDTQGTVDCGTLASGTDYGSGVVTPPSTPGAYFPFLKGAP